MYLLPYLCYDAKSLTHTFDTDNCNWAWLVRLSTSQFNRILQQAQDRHPAPSHAGRQLRIYYGTQVRNDPPTFLLYVNDPKLSHFSYMRYLENRLREEYPFLGTPVRLVLRKRKQE